MTTHTLRSTLGVALLTTSLMSCQSAAQLASTLANGAGGGAGGGALGRPNPPTLLHTDVRLTERPTEQQLAAYYCSQAVNVPAIISPCRVFGAIPTRDSLRFTFAVDLTLRNDNRIPLPTAEALLAFTAYPQAAGQHNLGALCVSLRNEDQVTDLPDGCRDRGDNIRTMADFGGAAARFLFNVATGQTRVQDVRIRTIPPGGEIHVVVSLGLDPESTVGLIRTMSESSIQGLQRGQQPHFTIPYQLEGSLWIEVQNFGRFAVAIPQTRGEFDLGAQLQQAATR
ncbi:MAG: hypothetical protein U0326_26575 [Polyangiales bacterium]